MYIHSFHRVVSLYRTSKRGYLYYSSIHPLWHQRYKIHNPLQHWVHVIGLTKTSARHETTFQNFWSVSLVVRDIVRLFQCTSILYEKEEFSVGNVVSKNPIFPLWFVWVGSVEYVLKPNYNMLSSTFSYIVSATDTICTHTFDRPIQHNQYHQPPSYFGMNNLTRATLPAQRL